MSRSAAVRAEHERAQRAPRARAHAPALPRRVSGPVAAPRGRADAGALAISEGVLAPNPVPRPRMPSRPPLRLAAGGASLALRVAEAAMEVSGSRTMDRLVRSRAWVVIVAFGLIGIVAMQVSMLKLNSGIGRAVETAATLERRNAALRGDVSRLSMGDRIQELAAARGFVMPEPGDVTYLSAGARGADGRRAAQRMSAPDAQIAGPAGAVAAASASAIAGGGAAATDLGATGADPAGAGTAATTGAAAPAATPAPGATTPAPVGAGGTPAPVGAGGTTAPVATAPAATTPAAANGTTAAVPTAAAATAPPAGGVTAP